MEYEFKIIKKLPGFDNEKWAQWQDAFSNDRWAQKLIAKANSIIRKQFIG